MAKPQESIWGNINTCAEIGIEVYRLVCRDSKGQMKTGIAIPADRAKDVLSEKALALGTVQNGFVSYEAPDKTLVPLYELMKAGGITDRHIAHRLRDLEALERNGKASVPEYFGCLPLPQTEFPRGYLGKPDTEGRTVSEIRSGLSIIKDKEHHLYIAIHEALAFRNLSSEARKLSEKVDGFYLFDSISCAIPLRELALHYPEVNDIIVNRESLEQTIVSKAQNYVVFWNSERAGPGDEIKANGSIPMMFLQEHLDFEADATRNAVSEFQAAHAHSADRGGMPVDVLELER